MAVEDRFILLRLREDKALLPEGNLLDKIAEALGSFSSEYNILCDWRGIQDVTGDVEDLIDLLCYRYDAKILATPSDTLFIKETFRRIPPILEVKSVPHRLSYRDIDFGVFDDESHHHDSYIYTRYDGQTIELESYESSEEWEALGFELDYQATVDAYRADYIGGVIQEIGRNSLLTEFVIQERADEILVTPYHAHAHYSIEVSNHLIIGRPGVVAEKTGSLLRPEIKGFEEKLNQRSLKESQVQTFLEQHPNILKMLGYGYNRIYPQVILQREDGTSLRPDFILEPIGSNWCDILDIKLPDKSVVVGGRDRKRFSAAVEELIAQLREYSAYFEDTRLAKRVEEIYGIKCYKPRLIGIIGRDPFIEDERQLRRLETQYTDVDVLTFDRLLEIARSRPLI
jgi:hypothetical protein